MRRPNARAVVGLALLLPLSWYVFSFLSEASYWARDRERRERRAAERDVAVRNGTECNDSHCRTCSLLMRLDRVCGSKLTEQCGADAGHQFFTGEDLPS